MTSKHTKGPWTAVERDNDKLIPSIVIMGKSAHGKDMYIGRMDFPTDARLCAAAPDMLEALKAAKSMLETASFYFPKSIKNHDRFSLLNVLANAVDPAIAKATSGV